MTSQTQTTALAGPRSVGRPLAAVREWVRARRANRSTLSRQIAAYPATRSASTTALPVVTATR
ncbi:hypothetical protein KZX45_12760 [Georgenia sp. EYE_87]|uniref:hypothetical protein n=1 Tax=Georgenia sp. EYE_87 TaxID=2853448 RepID=UPI0020056508|nr:hypothetical protein [Georgenia sp. EYE_87]MCK6211415.1 hypothetical protein [Georgenia sp. EYE_87]